MAIRQDGNTYYGLSGDDKPLGTPLNGRKFTEMDTSKEYRFDAENQRWLQQSGGGGGSSTLSGLTDVDISNPTNGQTIVYNATSGEWENGEGGGGIFLITGTNDAEGVVLDKTYAEIKNAYLGGSTCVINTEYEDSSVPEHVETANVYMQIVAIIEVESGDPGQTPISYIIRDAQGSMFNTDTPSGYPRTHK